MYSVTLSSRSSQRSKVNSFIGYCAFTYEPIFTKIGTEYFYGNSIHDLEVKVIQRSKVEAGNTFEWLAILFSFFVNGLPRGSFSKNKMASH